MRILTQLGTALAALVAGISAGRVAVSLDAPTPWPLITAVTVAVLAIYVLDGLVDTLHAHRAARRG
ncbi:hypothetical protein [Streptomyces sp. NPDC060027]|uniref:hypothetical protein n=1 Tax=Streptomyces sp. NPDC060027 TaxID=3347040 RepID=UPI003674AFBB